MNAAVKTDETKQAEKAQHLKAVEATRVEQAKYLAANPTEALGSGAAIAMLQSVYLTNIPKQYEWGKGLSPEGAFALATAAAQTGLNPLFGQILMLGGNIYLPEKGCHHIANTDPRFDGYELEPVPKSDFEAFGFKPDEIAFKCSVYRKDRTRPTVAYGRASQANVSLPVVRQHWLSEMAQKRAIQRAFIRAFALPFSGADETPDGDMIDVTPRSRVVPEAGQFLSQAERAKVALGSSRSVSASQWIGAAEIEEPVHVEAERADGATFRAEMIEIEAPADDSAPKTETPEPAQAEAPKAIIDPQILSEVRGMIAIPDINALCIVAAKAGMTAAQLLAFAKQATDGKVFTRPTFSKAMETLEKIATEKAAGA